MLIVFSYCRWYSSINIMNSMIYGLNIIDIFLYEFTVYIYMYRTPLMKYNILQPTIRTVCHIQLFILYLALEVTPWMGMSL